MIKIGENFPDATLFESTEIGEFCPVSPGKVQVAEAIKGKKIVVFGLPGAFTPTCSAKHVPGYVTHLDDFKKKGVDEVWCISVNDGYVMAAWGQAEKGFGKLRFLGDGSAELAKKLGIDNDLTSAGMGMRMKRFSAYVDNGVVKQFNLEQPGKFEVSNAETLLGQLG